MFVSFKAYPRYIRCYNITAHGNLAVKKVVVAVHEVIADPELDLLTPLIPHSHDILI